MTARTISVSVLLLALTAAVLPLRVARAERSVAALAQEYGRIAKRTDAAGYAKQSELLDAIAARKTSRAQKALFRLRDIHGRGDPRAVTLILCACVRHGTPDDLDKTIRWVEQTRDPRLIDRLHEVVASVEAPEARTHLRTKALRRATPPVKAQIARGLGESGNREAVPDLLLLLRERNRRLRVEALDALGHLADPRAVGSVRIFLRDDDFAVRDGAARALAKIAARTALRALIDALAEEKHPRVIESIAGALAAIDAPAAIGPLIASLVAVGDDDLRVAEALTRALQQLTGKGFDAEPAAWRDWWDTVKDTAWKRAAPDATGRTVARARYYGFEIHSSRVTFVLDISRSMGWNDRLDTAKKELLDALEHLPANTRFNLITYSDSAGAWQSGLRPATPNQVRRAMGFVSRQRPENGTNTYDALRLALEDEEVDTIFFLSDGHPSVGAETNPDRILAEVAKWNRYRRVHIHGVALVRGEPPPMWAGQEDVTRSVAFMKRLAEANGGRFKVIR